MPPDTALGNANSLRRLERAGRCFLLDISRGCETVEGMNKFLFAAVMTFALGGLTRAGDSPTYTPEEAGKHIGEQATVTGKIEDAHQTQGGPGFLNMGGRHPNETFTIFVSPGDSAAFKDLKEYMDKTVSVTGKIKDHNGKPEIMVKSPSDLTVKDGESGAASSPSATASPKSSP